MFQLSLFLTISVLPNVPVSRPVIEDVDSTSVRLGWQRVHIPSFGSDDSPLTFMVESQEGPGSEWRPIARDIPDTRYVVRDLKPRHDYNFRIRGIKGPEISEPTPPLPVFRSPCELPPFSPHQKKLLHNH